MTEIAELEFAPEVASLPLHSKSELEELKDSIRTKGFLREYPVITHDGKIYDGRNRYLAAKAVGVRPVFNNVASKRYALKLAESSYLQRIFTEDQKLQARVHFANLKSGDNQYTANKAGGSELNQQDSLSLNQISQEVGVSTSKTKKASSVNTAVVDQRIDSEIEMRVLAGKDKSSAAYTAISIITKEAERLVKDNDQEKINRITLQLSQDVAALANQEKIGIVRAANRFLNLKGNSKGHTTGNNDSEWYTPVIITDKAHKVMGSIDIDPASNDYAQTRIKATQYFTTETNGLLAGGVPRVWEGKVWCNPPYGKSVDGLNGCAEFIEHLLTQAELGNTTEYLVLVNSSNGTPWYSRMQKHCSAFGLSIERIQFDRHPEFVADKKDANTKGQTIFYYGSNVDKFYDEYAELFDISVPYRTINKD